MRSNSNETQQFQGHYIEWRAKRLAAIIDYYKPGFFLGKTVLEVGCGHGDIGGTLARLGATVTCSDARAEHLAVAKVRFPDIKTVIADLDREWPSGVYDLTIHMGVLYHIRDYRSALRRACENCHKMVLETEVADSDDPSYELSTAEYGFDQAMNGVGVRPSATGIESVLKDCGLTYTRISDSRCNSGYHEYDWSVTNSGQWRHGLRRFWFAEKCASLPRSSARQ
jgi:trans-aconitate methyltransferase